MESIESSRAKRKRAPQNRSSRAPSTTSTSELREPPKKKQKQRKKASTSKSNAKETADGYFSAKRILKQRLKGEQIYYLVDWEDDPNTGERFEPTWEPQESCTDLLIETWLDSQSQNDSIPQASELPSTPRPRPVKRKRLLIESQESQSPENSQLENPEIVGTAESASFQFATQDHIGAGHLPKEIKDSYEEESQNSGGHKQTIPQVEIQLQPGFDRDAYTAVILSSSQPSQSLHPSQLTQYSEDIPVPNPPTSQARPQQRRPYIWTEDLPETPLPGSSSYELPTQNTQIHSGGFLDSIESRSKIWTSSPHSLLQTAPESSGDINSQLAEPESHFADATYSQGLDPISPASHFAEDYPSSSLPTTRAEIAPEIDSVDSPNTIQEEAVSLARPQQEIQSQVSSEGLIRSSAVPYLDTTSVRTSIEVEDLPSHPEPPNASQKTPSTFTETREAAKLTASSRSPAVDVIKNIEAEYHERANRLSTPTRNPVSESPRTPHFRSDISSNMEQTPPSPSSGKFDATAKMQEMIAKKRAEVRAMQASRSSSVLSPPIISAKAPLSDHSPSPAPHQITAEGSPTLPLFIPVEEFVAPVQSVVDPASIHISRELSPDIKVDTMTDSNREFAVPLPMTSHTRDIYHQTVQNYKSQTYTFLTDEFFSENLVKQIDNMVEELSKLCDHQDLINDDYSTQRLESTETQARWAENISSKCIFIAELLLALRPHERHVVILSRPGRMLEILEALCRRHNFIFKRADESSWSESQGGPLKVTLLPTGDEVYVVEPASAVIAFDSTARSISYLESVRKTTNSAVLAPIISLLVTHSVEHLDKCFPNDEEPTGRKVKLVSYLNHIGDDVGKLDLEEYPDPAKAARLVAEFIVNVDSTWPIMDMPDIDAIDSASASQLGHDPDVIGDENVVENLGMLDVENRHAGTKRHSEDAMVGMGSPKRQKFVGLPADNVGPAAHKIVMDDIVPASSTIPDRTNISPEERIAYLEAQLREKDSKLCAKEEREVDLLRINQDLEDRCRDLESSFRDIQPKYQEALNERAQFEHDAKLGLERETTLRRQRDAKDAELRRVQARQDVIDSELDAARLALSTSSVPDVAELNNLRESYRRLNDENEGLRKRLTGISKDMDYLRENYQNASTAASGAATELRESQAVIRDLQKKVGEQVVRIHEIQHNSESSYLHQRIKGLEAEKTETARAYERVDAELKAMSNGRRGTRGTSTTPRSPRLGTGTMSPNPSRPSARGAGQQTTGSRGNSPAPGDLRPNRTAFGEALFQDTPSVPAAARWGNHLQ